MTRMISESLLFSLRTIDLHNARNEVHVTRMLAEKLGSRREVPYPAGTINGNCDLVCNDPAGAETWIEVKLAQTYFSQSDWRRSNLSLFEKHVYSESIREHTAVNDIKLKLASLVAAQACGCVGFLLVLYYSTLFPLPGGAIDRFKRQCGISSDSWTEFDSLEWKNPNHIEQPSFLRGLYWEKPLVGSQFV
jgi:hypothetical protein